MSLMVVGEIPGAFSLEQQINLAVQVRDSRVIEMDQQYHAHLTKIEQEVELLKQNEAVSSKNASKEASSTGSSISMHDLQTKYNQILAFRIAQAQMHYQQEMDDFIRKCEVENESVTATIMSLMRPLGMTSGKWQQIVQRLRTRLRIAIVADRTHKSNVPHRFFSLCNVVSFAKLDEGSMCLSICGSFQARIHELSENYTNSSTFNEFLSESERLLPQLVAFASKMHSSICQLAAGKDMIIPTERSYFITRCFPKILKSFYESFSLDISQAQAFQESHKKMEQALWKLRDRDHELQAQLALSEQQIGISQDLANEQKEDSNRIREVMKRYQNSAEEQVRVTNEMESTAKAELAVPMACLEEANASLLLIEKRHIVEIKSFNSPPPLVHLVLDAICILFETSPTWDNARKILGDANIVQRMLEFDKDTIPMEDFRQD